jgi:hypothetical protein
MLMLALSAAHSADKPTAPLPVVLPPVVQPSTPPLPAVPGIPPLPWLGVKVARPDSATRAQLPDLPNGIGFLVSSIDDGGPAVTAGIQPMDVVWKLDDQLLANEAQLTVLLRLKKPGEKVDLSLFRQGKPMVVPITLASPPANSHIVSPSLMDTAILPGAPGMPMRVVNVAERCARLETSDGKAELRENGDTFLVKITNSENATIYEGPLASHGDLTGIPEAWRHRVCALQRALENALNGRSMDMIRQPRPRVVPPAQPAPDTQNRTSDR